MQLINILTGFSITRTQRSFSQLLWYFKSSSKLKKQLKQEGDDFIFTNNYPCLLDKYASGGIASGAYFNHDLYVAQKIFEQQPVKHLDIGSRIDGFVAHVATYRKIEVIDIREINAKVKNITFIKKDLMIDDETFHNYCDSLSCLSVLEHLGLGRYGDTLDINGHKKGLLNISKIVKQGGICYISVPIGEQKIEFNAHRIFSIRYLLDLYEEYFSLHSFAYIDDKGEFFETTLTKELIDNNCNCRFGSGIFILIKK